MGVLFLKGGSYSSQGWVLVVLKGGLFSFSRVGVLVLGCRSRMDLIIGMVAVSYHNIGSQSKYGCGCPIMPQQL